MTLCVLAIGVMGTVGLQLSALRASQQSRYQTFATQLAADIAERLRASGGVEGTALDIAATSTSVSSTPADATADGRESCGSHACATPMSMPEVALWTERMRVELPAGRLRVCRDAHPWNAAGHARWDCDGGPDDAVFVKVGWQDISMRTRDGDLPPRLVMAIGAALSR